MGILLPEPEEPEMIDINHFCVYDILEVEKSQRATT